MSNRISMIICNIKHFHTVQFDPSNQHKSSCQLIANFELQNQQFYNSNQWEIFSKVYGIVSLNAKLYNSRKL